MEITSTIPCTYTNEIVGQSGVRVADDILESARLSLFESVWDQVRRHVNQLLNDKMESVLMEVLEFLRQEPLQCTNPLVPCGVVFIGANLGSYNTFFDRIEQQLSQNTDGGSRGTLPEFLVVRCEDSGVSRWKKMADHILAEFSESFRKVMGRRELDVPGSIAGLKDQYDMMVSKRKCRPELVLICQSIESFQSTDLLQNLISFIWSGLVRHGVQVKLLMSTEMLPEAIHHLFTAQTTSKIALKKILAPSPIMYLDAVVDLLTCDLDRFPIRIGSQSLALLVDLFLCHNFSIPSLMKGVKLALLHHFSGNPFTILYCSGKGSTAELTNLLQNEDVQNFLSDSIVQRALGFPVKAKKTDWVHLLQERFREFEMRMMNVFLMHQCLCCILKVIPTQSWGQKSREIYLQILMGRKSVLQDENYARIFRYICLLERGPLLDLIQDLKLLIRDLVDGDQCRIEGKLAEFEDNVKNVETKQVQLEDHLRAEQENGSSGEQTHRSSGTFSGDRRETAQTLRRRLLEMAQQKKQCSYFELEKERFSSYMNGIFQKFLVDFQEMPLARIYYCDPISELRACLSVHQRESVEKALIKGPSRYRGKLLALENLGNISVVNTFQIYQEHGRVIPLSDMFASFNELQKVSAASESSVKRRKLSKDEKRMNEQVTKIDFLGSVHELAWLGFLRSIQKNQDFVTKAD